jgi:methylisocitrate lyase
MNRERFRRLLQEPGIVPIPGAFDAWSARLVEQAGFPAVYMTGYGASASVLGRPDIGLMTMSEMVAHAKNMAAAVDLPLVVDGDTGYGGILNVIRTVKEFEAAGVAAIQLEDQVFPKRCGHMDGKQLIPKEEMAAKIRAAVVARRSEDLLIIARTDARAVTGLKDAIDRGRAYSDAGAHVIFVEAPQTVSEMEEIAASIDRPLVANMVEMGKTPFLSAEALEKIGYKIIIYPVSALFAATKAMMRLLQHLKKDGSTAGCLDDLVGFPEFNEIMGVREMRALEKKFSDSL